MLHCCYICTNSILLLLYNKLYAKLLLCTNQYTASVPYTIPIPYYISLGIQGNLDPMVLFGPDATIKERTEEILNATGKLLFIVCIVYMYMSILILSV